MKISDVLQVVIYPGLALLPKQMNSPAAIAMLLTIGLQESRFIYRRQVGGPARGFYQFEKKGGVAGVLLHHRGASPLIRDVLDRLQYDLDLDTSYAAIEHNDALATAFARLLLWTLPDTLPQKDEYERSWEQYIEAWRPGKPHRQTWNEFYRQAWGIFE